MPEPFFYRWEPGFQKKRRSLCMECYGHIEAGAKIMVGTGWGHKRIFTVRMHENCFKVMIIREVERWFRDNLNEYKVVKFSEEQKKELGRLRASIQYLKKKGVDKESGTMKEIMEKIKEIQSQRKVQE